MSLAILFVKLAYAMNVFILTPVLFSMYMDRGASPIRAFQGTIANSEGLRLLAAALWSAILIVSVAGFFWPKPVITVLILQVVYKVVFLLTYCLPKLRAGRIDEVPMGLTISFLLIVLTYPIISICGLTAN